MNLNKWVPTGFSMPTWTPLLIATALKNIVATAMVLPSGTDQKFTLPCSLPFLRCVLEIFGKAKLEQSGAMMSSPDARRLNTKGPLE
jgi:hypothetical protein